MPTSSPAAATVAAVARRSGRVRCSGAHEGSTFFAGDLYNRREVDVNEGPALRRPSRGATHEEGRGDHQAVQAGRGEGEPLGHRRAGYHRERGEGLRATEEIGR